MRDARLNNGGEEGIFWFDFGAVKVFEASDLQRKRSQMFEIQKGLLHKSVRFVRVIIIRRVIGSAQTELTLRGRHHGIVWQT